MTAPLRVVIVDDEPPALAGLRALLARHDEFTIVAEALGGKRAIAAIREHAPDIVILDVQMPEVDGFQVLESIQEGGGRLPFVIFVTAHDEFAVRAFDVHAVDYLLKPVSTERFSRALGRARDSIASMRSGELGQRLRELLEAHSNAVAASSALPRHQARILVRVGQRDEVLEASDIDWIQSDDYCSIIHCGGRRHLVRESLAAFEARLDPRTFARIHRSVIVNLSRVTARRRLAAGGVRVILRDGTQLPVSRARRARLDELLGGAS